MLEKNESETHYGLLLAVHLNLETARKLSRLHSDALARYIGVSTAQLQVLSEISRAPGISVNKLSQLCSSTASTTSNLLDKSEQLGWLQRKRDRRDRRVITLFITEKGKTILADYSTNLLGFPFPEPGAIPTKKLAAFNHCLEEFISNLRLNKKRTRRRITAKEPG